MVGDSMYSIVSCTIIGSGVALLASACSLVAVERVDDPLGGVRETRLQSAHSAQALEDWVAASLGLERHLAQHGRTYSGYGCSSLDKSNAPPNPKPQSDSVTQVKDSEEAANLDCVFVTGSMILPEDIITNVQTSGIDEGGLFKRRGDHLLALRDGRLFNIRIDGSDGPTLRLEQSVLLSDPDQQSGTWFDELMVFEGGAIVLSFDYERSVTRFQLFAMEANGQLTSSGLIEIQSEDYYSSSNYGMRLVGSQLSVQVRVGLGPEYQWQWPMWRSINTRETSGGTNSWRPLINAEDVLMPLAPISDPVIHTILMCDIDALMLGRMDCAATGLVAESWSEVYASKSATYVAMDAWREDAFFIDGFSPWSWRARQDERFSHLIETLIYRLPFDDEERPGAVFVTGERGNQFSFREVGSELIVVSEVHPGPEERRLAVHRVSLSQFSDKLEVARTPRIHTHELGVSHRHRTVRVADQHVLIGEHSRMLAHDKGLIGQAELVIIPHSGPQLQRILLSQSVDRVEQVDDRYFVSGVDPNGRWSMTLLDPGEPDRIRSLVIESHDNAEVRSHAFNWRLTGDDVLLVGIPGMRRLDEADGAYAGVSSVVSDFVFVLAQGRDLELAGVLDMQQLSAPGEECMDQFSCSDWYGNARLALIGNRIFALSGSQLTEARFIRRMVRPVRSVFLE